MSKLESNTSNLVFSCLVIALVATAGSLFFSEVMKFPPCSMCWYQRIFMYPLVVLFMTSILKQEAMVFRFTFPLVALGLFTSLYHNFVYYGILPESAAPCSMGISCATKYISLFGFISIPLMSLAAFSLLFILHVIFYRKRTQ